MLYLVLLGGGDRMFTLATISALSDILFTFIEGLLALRIILKFFGANSFTPFVVWVYQTSKPLLVPFEGIFPSATAQGGFVLEISALFALLVYGLIAYGISEGLNELENSRTERKK